MWELIRKKPALAIPWYLGLSWLYYVWDVSLVPDTAFDQLCVELLHTFPTLEHRHKYLVKHEVLRSGSGFYLNHEDFPEICRSAFMTLAIEDRHVTRKRGRLVRA
jgi:hypothetical protein